MAHQHNNYPEFSVLKGSSTVYHKTDDRRAKSKSSHNLSAGEKEVVAQKSKLF